MSFFTRNFYNILSYYKHVHGSSRQLGVIANHIRKRHYRGCYYTQNNKWCFGVLFLWQHSMSHNTHIKKNYNKKKERKKDTLYIYS